MEMSSVTSPSTRASSAASSSIQTYPCTLVKMEVKREVGLNAGLGAISYLARMRSPRGSRATKVKRKALRAASMRSFRSFFFFAYFSTASRCVRLLLTINARACSRLSKRERYAARSAGLPSGSTGILSMPVPDGMTRVILTDAGAESFGFFRLSSRSMHS